MNIRRFLIFAFTHAILNSLIYWFVASVYVENAFLMWGLVSITLIVSAVIVYRWKSLQSVKEQVAAFFGYFLIAFAIPFAVLATLILNSLFKSLLS